LSNNFVDWSVGPEWWLNQFVSVFVNNNIRNKNNNKKRKKKDKRTKNHKKDILKYISAEILFERA
jgi:hypothetical protein